MILFLYFVLSSIIARARASAGDARPQNSDKGRPTIKRQEILIKLIGGAK